MGMAALGCWLLGSILFARIFFAQMHNRTSYIIAALLVL
jgi:hypothetical protein